MTELKDLEKEAQVGGSETTINENLTESGEESPQLRPLKETVSRHSRRSQAAHSDPYDSDPYEALERAFSPDLEIEAEHAGHEPISRARTGTSFGSTASRHPDFEVVFEPDDPLNPRNWSLAYRGWTLFSVSVSCWVVVLYSTSYTASIPGLMEEFNIKSSTTVTLGVTTYLLGLAVGSLIVAPMSEQYGRRPVYLICLFAFTLLVLPCCLATSLTEILIVRFFG